MSEPTGVDTSQTAQPADHRVRHLPPQPARRLSPVPDPRSTGHHPAFDGPELVGFSGLTLGEIAERGGLKRIDAVAWRDFDDPEAGGSELHAHRIMSEWADAGLDVVLTTSAVRGDRPVARRDGYRVIRRSGRYGVFPRAMASGALGRIGAGDGLVEIWNGMPFLSPLWSRCPSVVFLHHVHAEMWDMVLPPVLAKVGYAIEHRLAPPIYRGSRIVTLSSSSKGEIVERLGIPADRVTVVPPGVEDRFAPGGERAEAPLVVAVGRLVPVKRFDRLVDALVRVRAQHPTLTAVIAGEGYEREALEERIAAHGAQEWIRLPGYVTDDELVDLYRRAWVVASSSQREGWGMTVTEAGACGTPAVATRISGHEDALVDGGTGLLADDVGGLAEGIGRLLDDDVLRRRLGHAAREYSEQFTWQTTARATLAALASEAIRRHHV